jgi:Lrp/AsnC family leucine-responsive transcriptional regulator
MKLNQDELDLDDIDLRILMLLQEHCKMSLAKIGERVGLSAPAVIERIKKLEDNGIVTGYTAVLNARRLGLDITAFIGVSISHPQGIETFEREVDQLPDVLECHHVTGGYTLLIKVKTMNTSTLEELIRRIRSIDGVGRTETMVVLSTHTEQLKLNLELESPPVTKRGRRNGERPAVRAGRVA